MKYKSWKDVPVKGQFEIINYYSSHNYILHKIYDYDLFGARYNPTTTFVKNITPSYPGGNWLHISCIELIEHKINHLENFTKIFKQL